MSDPVGAWFRLRRLPGRLGTVGVLRLLVFQVVQVAVFVVLVRGTWAAVLGSGVGAIAIVATFGRWRGRWLTDQAVLWLRYRRGRGGAAPAGAVRDDPRLAALGRLVPDLVVEDIAAAAEDARLGMGSDGAGWFTVLEVEPAGPGVAPPVPLAALARVAAEAEPAGVVIQVVTHTVPVPGGVAAPQRLLWVAVRLDADLVADAAVDDLREGPAHQVDVPAVLAELTRRVRRALRRHGLGARGLDADGVIDALALSCDLAATEAPALGAVREDWDAWHSPRLAHRCCWLRTWPDPDRSTTLLAGLGESPEARVSVSLVLQPRDEAESDLRCLIRFAAPPDRIAPVYDRADRLAHQLGGALFPLDGEHALGVYGSAPSGGGAR